MPKLSLENWFRRFAAVLSLDFFPQANRWVYWLKNPIWVLVLAITGSALCGVFLNPFIFVITGALAVTTIVGTVLPWIAIKNISCQILFDVPRSTVGKSALVRLRIHNRSWLPVWGLSLIEGFTSSEVQNAATESDEGLAFRCVRGRSTVEYSWGFQPRKRGIFPLNDIAKIETSFPFGLCRFQRTAEFNGRLIVWPETVTLDGLPDSVQCESIQDQFSDRRVGEFGDMLGTRQYRQGDSLRRVHWAQTARQGELIVVERQAPVSSVAKVAVDLSPDSHAEATRSATTEQCVRIAASLCESLLRQGCHVELHVGQEVFVGSSSTAGLNTVMDALAASKLTSRSSIPDAFATGNPSGGFRCAVTTDRSPECRNCMQIVVTTTQKSVLQDSTDVAFSKEQNFNLPADASLNELVKLWSRSSTCQN